jgi:hypothetical protein
MRRSLVHLMILVLAVGTSACNLEDDRAPTDDAGSSDADASNDTSPLTCDDATVACEDDCVDLDSDPDHCGACGNACEAPRAVSSGCDGGVCQLACADGFTDENGDLLDSDGDGCETQCEPTDEVCDGNENDCDGEIDEGVMRTWYLDADADGYGQDVDPKEQCDRPSPRYVEQGGDCNDTDDAINPDVEEVCDGLDNNCDDQIDDGVQTTYYVDSDGDGYGTEGTQREGCSAPDGFVDRSGDCDDTDERAHPDQTSYFATERNRGGFDFNCDGNIEAAQVEVSSGECMYIGACARFSSRCVPGPDAPGWSGSIPNCGKPGEVFAGCQSCFGPVGSCNGAAFYGIETQQCR